MGANNSSLSYHTLKLMPEHAIFKLWAIRSRQTGWLPSPVLCLEKASDPPLPDDEARAELSRLLVTVNMTANRRLEKIRKQMKDEEQDDLPDLDAETVVFISKNELTAWLLVYPPVGYGREIDREMLMKELERQQICFGVDYDVIDQLFQKTVRYFELIRIAGGQPPVHGTDGYVNDLFPRNRDRTPVVDEKGRIDYMNLNFIHNVEEGGVICQIIPPVEGTPGRTVRNQEIAPRKGKTAVVPRGRNTYLSEDGYTLYAAITGNVEFSGRSFQISPVLDIPGDVDYAVGNINFMGDVHIRGDICRGFTVRAMGNIIVDGMIESCTVEAGRDLIIAGGIQGDDQAVIRAQRSIFAKFMENCCIYAKVSLEAACIINCDVYCDGTVTVRSGHKSIIGGKIYAAREVSAGTVGTRMGVRTDIILGGQPCEEFDYAVLTGETKELQREMDKVERQPEGPDRTIRMNKLRMRLVDNNNKLEMLRMDRAMEIRENGNSSGGRMSSDTVYPGTKLTIDGVVYSFDEKVILCSAKLKDGEISVI